MLRRDYWDRYVTSSVNFDKMFVILIRVSMGARYNVKTLTLPL